MLVTLRRRRVGRLAEDRARMRRSDDRSTWMARRHLGVDVVSVVCAVTGEGRDGTSDLVEQRTDLRAIVDVIGGQRGRHDLARVAVHAEMQLLPGPARPRAMFFDQPFAGTAQPQAGALSTSRCTGALLDAGRTTGNVSARRLSAE